MPFGERWGLVNCSTESPAEVQYIRTVLRNGIMLGLWMCCLLNVAVVTCAKNSLFSCYYRY